MIKERILDFNAPTRLLKASVKYSILKCKTYHHIQPYFLAKHLGMPIPRSEHTPYTYPKATYAEFDEVSSLQ